MWVFIPEDKRVERIQLESQLQILVTVASSRQCGTAGLVVPPYNNEMTKNTVFFSHYRFEEELVFDCLVKGGGALKPRVNPNPNTIFCGVDVRVSMCLMQLRWNNFSKWTARTSPKTITTSLRAHLVTIQLSSSR